MTTTTFNRQLSLLVKGILEANKIDDLKLEIDLVTAVHRLVEARKDPAEMVRVREDALSSFLAGAAKESEFIEMEGRVKKSMGISIDGRGSYEKMVRFLVAKDKEGQTVEKYAQWCKDNPFTAPKFFQIAQKPDLLMTTWEMAFISEPSEEVRPEYQKVTHVETEAVPNPYEKPSILRKKA